jgi:exodeoxyribonuclease VIII
MKVLDIMVDLETLGLGNTPVISQISAVNFDIESGDVFEEFNNVVKPQTCVQLGMKIDGGTVEWWLKQDYPVLEKVIVNSITDGRPIKEALILLRDFIEESKKTHGVKDVRIWGNGTLADNKWLESAYEMAGIPIPWKYWENSDVRTLVDLGWRLSGKDFKKDTSFVGEKHNAIDDCKHQIKYCSAIYKELKK